MKRDNPSNIYEDYAHAQHHTVPATLFLFTILCYRALILSYRACMLFHLACILSYCSLILSCFFPFIILCIMRVSYVSCICNSRGMRMSEKIKTMIVQHLLMHLSVEAMRVSGSSWRPLKCIFRLTGVTFILSYLKSILSCRAWILFYCAFILSYRAFILSYRLSYKK